MRKHNFDCLIVGAPWGAMPWISNNDLYYISNYVPHSNRGGTYIVFPLEGEPQLGVSNSVGPQYLHCALATSWIKEIVGSFYPVKDIVNKIKKLKLEKGRLGIAGYRMGMFPASVYDALRESFPAATFADATAVLGEAMDAVSRTSK